jgi:hypothetical protein
MTNTTRSDGFPRSPAASAGRGENDILGKMLQFLEIDDDEKESAKHLLKLFVEHGDDIVVNFYRKVQASAISSHVTDEAIERLKPKQKAHWSTLFGSDFGGDYARSVRRLGIQHRDIDLNVTWFVAGYAKLKLEFLKVIAATEIPPEKKNRLIATLEKYVAVDTALALSTYEALLLD